jgi:hypothetical protein
MMKWVYNDGGRLEAGFERPTHDCAVRAVAIATGRPYREIHFVLGLGNATQVEIRGRRKCGGRRTVNEGVAVGRKWFRDYMRLVGFKWMRVRRGLYLGRDALPKGRLVVWIDGHLCAVIDGVLHDTYDSSQGGTERVRGYWVLRGERQQGLWRGLLAKISRWMSAA